MIHTQEMWGAKCDSCGEDWDNGDGIGYYTDREHVRYSLTESEWRVDGDKCYCPNCHTVGDNDEVIIISKPA